MPWLTATERYRLYNEAVRDNADEYGTIPHCDSRILHRPDDCEYCDRPDLQGARRQLGIAFTGEAPHGEQIPCEADLTRPQGEDNDHRRWGGNKPTSAIGDPTWPTETFASHVMYGDMGGRS